MALAHAVDTLREAPHAARQLGMIEVLVFQRRVDVQQRGRHLHRMLGCNGAAAVHGVRRRLQQRLGQRLTFGVELLQRLADQRELLGQARQALQVATGNRRPHVLGCGDALACLRQHRRIEPAEARAVVVDGVWIPQLECLARRGQSRPGGLALVGHGLSAKEQQILCQAIGCIGALAGAQLRKQPRGQALAVDIDLQQAIGLRFVDSGRELPQRGQAILAASRQAGKQIAHALGGAGIAAAHQGQRLTFELGLGVGIRALGRRRIGRSHRAPLPVAVPQIGRVHAAGTGQLLQRLVLREHRRRRDQFAGQQAGKVVKQCERASLDHVDMGRRHAARLARKLDDRGFSGAQHQRRGGHAHQFERTGALVHLRTRVAQDRRIDGVDVGAALRVGFLQVATQRLVRGLQRTTQFVVHPGQCAQVVGHLVVASSGHVRSTPGSSSVRLGERFGQLTLNRATDCLSSSALRDNSRTICAVERVPSPVCSVTAKMCWMFEATTLADCASLDACVEMF